MPQIQYRAQMTTDLTTLVQDSGCIGNLCADPRQRDAIEIVLLNIINAAFSQGTAKTTAELVEQAKCYQCLSPIERQAVLDMQLYRFASQFSQDLPELGGGNGELIKELFCLTCPGVDLGAIKLALWVQFFYNLYVLEFFERG